MTLKDQSLFTARALEILAREMTQSTRDVPARYIMAVSQHAADLRKAANGSGVQGSTSGAESSARVTKARK